MLSGLVEINFIQKNRKKKNGKNLEKRNRILMLFDINRNSKN